MQRKNILVKGKLLVQKLWSKSGISVYRIINRTVLWTLWERERVGRLGRMALKHVKYHV